MLILLLSSCQHPTKTSDDYDSRTDIIPVVIIGGGASGLASGMRLLELGIEPIILEKEHTLGGAGIHAGRFFGVDTQLQAEQEIIDTVDNALNEWSLFTGAPPDHNVKLFIENSADTLNWIEAFGVVFDSVQLDIGAGSVPRIHSLSPLSPHPLTLWIEQLTPYAQVNQTVQSIEYIDNRFIVETQNNLYTSEHVIVATGGFARNIDIVSENNPAITEHNWHMEAWTGMVGDSISWFEHLSVPLQNMNHVGLYAHGVTDIYLNHPEIMVIPALERSLILNQDGLRPFNEQYTQSLKGGHMMLEEERLYAIFDAPLWSGTTLQGMGYNYPQPPIITSEEYSSIGEVTVANDLRDLALELDMDIATMMNTISEYNEGILQGSDSLDKNIPNLTAIQMSPFYAVEIQLSAGKSFGGAQTNTFGATSLDNLYSVGESAGFLGSTSSGWGFSGSITACYYLGKKAAEDIAIHYSR